MQKNINNTFKEIRSKKNLSLEYVCNGICSISTLSKFENNIGDIPLNKFLKLLNKLEISESEFFSYIDNNTELIDSNFLDYIAVLYKKKDTNSLYNIINKLKQKFTLSNSKIDFLCYMITVNFYNDLTGIQLCSPIEKERLYNTLFRTEEWDKLEIESFGNTITLLKDNFIYLLSNELLAQLNRIAKVNSSLYYNSCFTLLNAFQVLIIRHSKLAKKLDSKLSNYKFMEVNASFNIGLYFLHNLLKINKNDVYKYRELEQIIKFLKKTNCNTLSHKLHNVLTTYLNNQ